MLTRMEPHGHGPGASFTHRFAWRHIAATWVCDALASHAHDAHEPNKHNEINEGRNPRPLERNNRGLEQTKNAEIDFSEAITVPVALRSLTGGQNWIIHTVVAAACRFVAQTSLYFSTRGLRCQDASFRGP